MAESSEKKCEREFRKVFENDKPLTVNRSYGRQKYATVKQFDISNKLKELATEESNSESSSSDENDLNNEIQFGDFENLEKESFIEEENQESFQLENESFNEEDNESCNLSDDVKRIELEKQSERFIKLSVTCSNALSEEELNNVLEEILPKADILKFQIICPSDACLLLILTKQSLPLEQLLSVERALIKQMNGLVLNENAFVSEDLKLRLSTLDENKCSEISEMYDKIFQDNELKAEFTNVLCLHCTSLKNISEQKLNMNYSYEDKTLQCILGMTGKATQEIVSEHLTNSNCNAEVLSPSSQIVNLCLQVLEHMLTVDPNLPWKNLSHEDFSLLHCLTRLLGWCISYLFPPGHFEQVQVNAKSLLYLFHRSTLVSILKILAILSYNLDQYDSFTNLKGLMERIMICMLKSYFHTKDDYFDVQVLALELMINFFIKHKKTCVLLCLKKFPINDKDQVLAVEALLKILLNSLLKINEIRQKTLEKLESAAEDDSESVQSDTNSIIKDADEDMELSTIVSFISILLSFFMDTKKSFSGFIRERLSLEKSSEAVTVSKRFLQFTAITGGMPVTGVLLLRHAIKRLTHLHDSETNTNC